MSVTVPQSVKNVGTNSYYFNCRATALTNAVTEPVGKDYIITEFEKILEYTDLMPEMETASYLYFQVCLSGKSTKNDPKPVKGINAKTWGKYAKNENGDYNGLTWHTVYTSTEALLKLIQRGFIIRFGIKNEGNKKDNFVGAYGIALDLDCDTSIDYVQTLDLCIANQIKPNIIHYSPSGNDSNNKLRLILLFNDLATDYDQLTDYIRTLNSFLPNAAKQVHDPARFFYTTLLDIPYIYLDDYTDFNQEYTRLESNGDLVKTLSKEPIDSIQTVSDTKRDTANKQFVDYLNEKILTDGQTIFDLIPLWCEHFDLSLENWHKHDSPGSNLEQWRGLDPIDPVNSSTGSSFTVYHANDDTYGYNSGRSGISGDMPDLWLRLSCQSWVINDNLKVKSLWWNAIREICEYHKVPDFSVLYERQQIKDRPTLESCIDTRKLEKGIVLLLPHLVWKMFLDDHQDSFYIQSSSGKYWLYTENDNVWKCLNRTQFLAEFRSYLSAFGSVLGIPVESLLTSTFVNGLVTCMSMTPKENSVAKFAFDYNYVPCANGAFDLVNHELVSYHPGIKNTMKLGLNYKPSTGVGLKAFRDFLHYIVVDPECVEDVLKWIACTVQYKGFYTRKALSLVGDPSAGKSLLTDLIKAMVMSSTEDFYHVLAKDLKAHTLLSEGSRFSTLQLEGIVLGVITEFNGLPQHSDGSLLKDLIANPTDDSRGVAVSIEYKGGDHGEIKVRAAILTNGQNFPKLPSNDYGWDRRFMPVRVRRNPVINDEIFINPKLYLEDFFSWCLEQNVDEYIDYFIQIAKNKDANNWITRATKEMKIANNRYWRFAEECLIATEGSSVDGKAVYSKYCEWCNVSNEKPGTRRIFTENLKNVLTDMYGLTMNDKEKDGYIHGIIIDPNS